MTDELLDYLQSIKGEPSLRDIIIANAKRAEQECDDGEHETPASAWDELHERASDYAWQTDKGRE